MTFWLRPWLVDGTGQDQTKRRQKSMDESSCIVIKASHHMACDNVEHAASRTTGKWRTAVNGSMADSWTNHVSQSQGSGPTKGFPSPPRALAPTPHISSPKSQVPNPQVLQVLLSPALGLNRPVAATRHPSRSDLLTGTSRPLLLHRLQFQSAFSIHHTSSNCLRGRRPWLCSFANSCLPEPSLPSAGQFPY